ncbi:MAG: Smr/MutS family protein [Gemmatimonadales bacterium]
MARRGSRPLGHDPFDPLDGPVGDTLDLHGFARIEARALLESYLASRRRQRPGTLVHIITGRGRNSPGTPVLKPMVKGYLATAPASVVRAWGRDLDDGGFLVRLAGQS